MELLIVIAFWCYQAVGVLEAGVEQQKPVVIETSSVWTEQAHGYSETAPVWVNTMKEMKRQAVVK